MQTKELKGRIILKHDTAANWKTAGEKGFCPLANEIIMFDPDDSCAMIRYKIGRWANNEKTELTNINDLPFEANLMYVEQQLTDEQKKVARENIESASKNTVDILEGRIETIEEVIPEVVTKTAENQTINGNITITGNLIVQGETDIEENDLFVGDLTILAQNWLGEQSPYYQVLELPCASSVSKIDIYPTIFQLQYLETAQIALTIENNNGTITIYALHNKPTEDLVIQVAVSEVVHGTVETNGTGTFLTKAEGVCKEEFETFSEKTEKRLDRLESKVAPEYIVEDHESAYEKTVPYYSCGYADLEWMEGATYVDSEGHLKDTKVTEIVSERVNIWDIDWVYSPAEFENTETGYITKDYNRSVIDTDSFVRLTGVKAGDVITISYKCRPYSGTMTGEYGAMRFLKRANDASTIPIANMGFNNGETKYGTFTVPENFDYQHYWGLYLMGSNTSGSRVEFYDFMISKGDTLPPYQKYRETTIIPIPEEIQNIEGYGRYNSRLNFDDNTLSVTYGWYEFTGNEGWVNVGGTNSAGNGFYKYYTDAVVGKMKSGSGQKGFCDKFPANAPWSNPKENGIRFGQSNAAIYFYHSDAMSLAQLRELTKGMRICYPLKDELCSIHTVDIDFDGLLPVGGTSKVRFENEDKQPVPSKITYMLKEDAQFDEQVV